MIWNCFKVKSIWMLLRYRYLKPNFYCTFGWWTIRRDSVSFVPRNQTWWKTKTLPSTTPHKNFLSSATTILKFFFRNLGASERRKCFFFLKGTLNFTNSNFFPLHESFLFAETDWNNFHMKKIAINQLSNRVYYNQMYHIKLNIFLMIKTLKIN